MRVVAESTPLIASLREVRVAAAATAAAAGSAKAFACANRQHLAAFPWFTALLRIEAAATSAVGSVTDCIWAGRRALSAAAAAAATVVGS